MRYKHIYFMFKNNINYIAAIISYGQIFVFELMLNAPVSGHLGTLPPFYGTLTQN